MGAQVLSVLAGLGKSKAGKASASDESDDGDSPEEERDEDDSMALDSAAGAVMSAMRRGDRSGFRKALEEFLDLR